MSEPKSFKKEANANVRIVLFASSLDIVLSFSEEQYKPVRNGLGNQAIMIDDNLIEKG
jgi:hypothetical protein